MTMTMQILIGLFLLGTAVGFVGGLLGVGGGILVVPMLVLVFGFDQKTANGTSLMMLLPPAAIPAIYRYWKAGNINVPAALVLAMGFVIGAYLGAHLANSPWLHADRLRQIFVIFILFMAGLMLFRGDRIVRAVTMTLILVAAYGVGYLLLRMLGKKLERPSASDIYRRRVEEPFAPDYEI